MSWQHGGVSITDEISLGELIAKALSVWREIRSSEPADDANYSELIERASKFDNSIDLGMQLVQGDDPAQVAVGAHLLAVTSQAADELRDSVVNTLLTYLMNRVESGSIGQYRQGFVDDDQVALCAVIRALGVLAAPSSKELLLVLIRGDHAPVASAAVKSLGKVCANSGVSSKDIDVFCTAMESAHLGVRQAAVSAAAYDLQGEFDGFREILARRLFDLDDMVRWLAIVALAKLKDDRAFPAIQASLESENVNRFTWESAALLGDPRLLEPLKDVAAWWEGDDNLVAAALKNCSGMAF